MKKLIFTKKLRYKVLSPRRRGSFLHGCQVYHQTQIFSTLWSDLSKKVRVDFSFRGSLSVRESVFQNGRSYWRSNIKMPKYCRDAYQILPYIGHQGQISQQREIYQMFRCHFYFVTPCDSWSILNETKHLTNMVLLTCLFLMISGTIWFVCYIQSFWFFYSHRGSHLEKRPLWRKW